MMDDYAYLLSLAKRASNSTPMTDATVSATATNASCGDECTVHLKVTDGVIEEVSVEAIGCVISRASAAVVMGQIGQSTFAELRLDKSASTPWAIASLGQMTGKEVRELLGVAVSPLRERCLTTALNALQIAIAKL